MRCFVEASRVARMATVDGSGEPYVVPICFALQGPRLYSVLDAKPKSRPVAELQRMRNLKARPRAAVIVDRWDEDWQRLGWVHLRGTARILEPGPEQREALELLRAKYPQYHTMALQECPVIVLDLDSARHWGDLSRPNG